jgi:hypothetical protein
MENGPADAEPRHREWRGNEIVDVPIMCSLTRFGLKSPRLLPTMLRDYRRVLRSANEAEPASFGLLKSAFLIENPSTCYSLSIWSGEPTFSAHVPHHVQVANKTLARLSYEPGSGPELWTTRWRLASVTRNLNWDGFDLGRLISQERV